MQPPLLAHLALLGEGGHAATVGQEPGVALAAAAALGRQPAIAVVDQVGQQLAREVVDRRAHRDMDLEVVAGGAVPALALAVGARTGPAVRMVAKRQQRGDVAVGDQPHVTAGAAVTAVGAAFGHVRLPPERDAAGAAVAATNVQVGFVDEGAHGTAA